MRGRTLISSFFLFFFILSPPIFAQEVLSPTEIVKRSDDLMRGNSTTGIYTMEILTPNWQRKLELHVDSVGRDQVFIRILSPAKEAGIGTLRIKNEMWNYLPQVEKVIKIPPSMMMQSWMGSDFANDDLVKESSVVHDYTHQIVETINIDGHEVHKIEFIPKPKAAVVWGRLFRWVRKDDFVPLQEEFYSEKGKLIKVLKYSDIGTVSNRLIPKVWTMTSMIKPGHQTVIRLVDVQYDLSLDPNIFTLSYLQKIP
ncbi:MAG: outer membrane lipoprotein-sorting protein [Candidatus Omnitrophica bacterium]|nr:outer membrane lipoprotein-sorting protein [Candidatus Omnitrophota bacterium]